MFLCVYCAQNWPIRSWRKKRKRSLKWTQTSNHMLHRVTMSWMDTPLTNHRTQMAHLLLKHMPTSHPTTCLQITWPGTVRPRHHVQTFPQTLTPNELTCCCGNRCRGGARAGEAGRRWCSAWKRLMALCGELITVSDCGRSPWQQAVRCSDSEGSDSSVKRQQLTQWPLRGPQRATRPYVYNWPWKYHIQSDDIHQMTAS